MSRKINKRQLYNTIFRYFGLFCTFLGLVMLLVFIVDILFDGLHRLSGEFLTNLPSRKPEESGIYTAWTGTIWVMVVTAVISLPIGIAAGLYMEEYSSKNFINKLLEINIANLAGVPSIIYGLLGLEIFSRMMNLGPSVLAGSLTLALLILPIIIVATRESLKAVPFSVREGAYALGSTKWQAIYYQVLPASFGGIMTGVILAISRAIGETAPLIAIGALTYVPFAPKSIFDEFTVLPIQIFNWVSRPQAGFTTNAAGAIIILLAITLAINALAIYLRNRWQSKTKW